MKKKSKFDFLAADRERAPEEAPMLEPVQDGTERKPSGQRIRADLLRAIKIMAAVTGRPQYVLIEEALEQYLASKRTI